WRTWSWTSGRGARAPARRWSPPPSTRPAAAERRRSSCAPRPAGRRPTASTRDWASAGTSPTCTYGSSDPVGRPARRAGRPAAHIRAGRLSVVEAPARHVVGLETHVVARYRPVGAVSLHRAVRVDHLLHVDQRLLGDRSPEAVHGEPRGELARE